MTANTNVCWQNFDKWLALKHRAQERKRRHPDTHRNNRGVPVLGSSREKPQESPAATSDPKTRSVRWNDGQEVQGGQQLTGAGSQSRAPDDGDRVKGQSRRSDS